MRGIRSTVPTGKIIHGISSSVDPLTDSGGNEHHLGQLSDVNSLSTVAYIGLTGFQIID